MSASILVPSDGSADSERALAIAVPLARALSLSIVLFWAWEGFADVPATVSDAVIGQIRSHSSPAPSRRALRGGAARGSVGQRTQTPVGLVSPRAGLAQFLVDVIDRSATLTDVHGVQSSGGVLVAPRPAALRSLVGAWREMRYAWKRQQIDSSFALDTPLPTTAQPAVLSETG